MTSPAFARTLPIPSAVVKRGLDLVAASVVLVIAAPLFAAIAVAIRLTSRGPVLFRQVRVGLHGDEFVMLKFRSMYDRVDDAPHRDYVTALLTTDPGESNAKGVYKLADDPRITRVGAILRRLSLDELPQLFNVVRNEMSLVGPRPALPFEVALYEPRELDRFAVRPGITGLWQVSGRNRLNMKEMLELDLQYVQRQRLSLDLWILSKTFAAVLRGDGAE